jgi:sec-independent protein translocase protein TatA
MGGLGTTEIVVIAVVALILFGPNKIPEFARQLGKAVNMFKKGMSEGLNEDLSDKKDGAKKDDSETKH